MWRNFSLFVAAFDCCAVFMWLYGIYYGDVGMLDARPVATPADAGTIVTLTLWLIVNAIASVRLFLIEEEK